MEYYYKCEVCTGVCIPTIKNNEFSILSSEEQNRIIEKGRSTPYLQIIQQQGNVTRRFHLKQYEQYTWLTGCVHSFSLFCFPCLLFSGVNTTWTHAGFTDLKNFATTAKKHDCSVKHLESSLKYYTLRKKILERTSNSQGPQSQGQPDIDIQNAKVDRNRNIFQRLIDIVCFLGKQELLFNPCDQNIPSGSKGNYLEAVDLLAKYDGVLDNHLQTCGSFTGSNQIQNYLRASVASVLTDAIKKQIDRADFVAMMVEQTHDINGKDHLVVILRYMQESEVYDRFIKYIDISADRTAETISAILLEVLSELNCLTKLVAQTYDGANVLSSEIDKLQSLVCQQCPYAMHVWCSAHSLNLVLSKSCEQSIPETKRFFNLIKSLANFFKNSTQRQGQYNKMADMKKLPRAADSQWTYGSVTVNAIFCSCSHLIELFEDMAENETAWDGETLCQVSTFLHSLKEFDFQFFLHVFNEIFTETDELHDILQRKSSEVTYCVQKINGFECFLESFKSRFENIFDTVRQFTGPPKRKHNTLDAKKNYERIFIEIISNISNKCLDRYKSLKDLKFFELLSCQNYIKYDENTPSQLISQLIKEYPFSFESNRLTNELRCIYKSPEFRQMAIYNIIENMYENHINTIFPESLKLAKLLVTIPASSAFDDKSFSSLNRIHTHLNNTLGQQRLTDLSIIAVEKTLLMELKRDPNFYNGVIQKYLQRDSRDDLTYK